ncbi:MAG: hypothetical protein OHK0022_50530 [Roseiflexaceae bacterium]
MARFFQPQQWIAVGEYLLYIHGFLDEISPAPRGQAPTVATETIALVQGAVDRLVYVNVEYQNLTSDQTLSYRLNQWTVFDSEGYAYPAVSSSTAGLFTERGRPPLRDGALGPGTRVRGWMAFRVPYGCELERLQFISGFLTSKIADISLHRPS